MRFTGSQFKLLSVGKGGAIVEPGDGEVLVPPIVQPVAVIAAPHALSSAGPQSMSFNYWSYHIMAAGGGTNTFDPMSAGLWRCTATGEFLIGTAAAVAGQNTRIQLYNNISGTAITLFEFDCNRLTPRQQMFFREWDFHFIENGWQFRLQSDADATISGSLSLGVYHQRILL